ncbi:MAG: metalloregulator ArsR/SmtB family transcription factor [Gammaproteobacteria bacterium]|nr:metalloregulator ArsR/SmtB family transcription factor [Gammaproteobacteria bacterium]
MKTRQIKDHLYAQVARIGKAMASPKRLELLEMLCQGEFSVEHLAAQTSMSVRLVSAHLKELKMAQLVRTRRAGTYIYYRLADTGVADLWVALRVAAEGHLSELREAKTGLVDRGEEIAALDGAQLMSWAKLGKVIVLDVRPQPEYAAGHLPYARSLPLDDIKRGSVALPKNRPIVTYCRGPFCLMAKEAVGVLTRGGYRASRFESGVAEWRSQGLPVVKD